MPIVEENGSLYEETMMSLRELRRTACFGSIVAGTHDLFELIPRVKRLYLWWLAEESMGAGFPSPEILAVYEDLNNLIESWTMDPRLQNSPGNEEWNQRRVAAEVIRCGLRTYLAASCGGAAPSQSIWEPIEREAKRVVDTAMLVKDSLYASHIAWALVIAGSCLMDGEYRRTLTGILSQSRYNMRHLSAVSRGLELLWDDTDGSAYGPYGLQMVVRKHRISLCIM